MTEYLAAARVALKDWHDDTKSNVQRWGGVGEHGVTPMSSGCYAGLEPRAFPKSEYMYLIFHGDGVDLSIPELSDFEAQNEKVGANPRAYNQFEGTERSLKWVKFLLSNQSPWRFLHDFMAIKDANEINHTGWLFERLVQLPPALLYNFAMAQRMLWENSPCASHWYHLVDKGVDPAGALFIASNFTLSPGAKSIDGPYSVYYPWSFLEGGTLDCAKRFITGAPKLTEPGGRATPNVLPLWQCSDYAKWISKTNELATRSNLSLDEILDIVALAVDTQED
jgi:hypothetical protein